LPGYLNKRLFDVMASEGLPHPRNTIEVAQPEMDQLNDGGDKN